MYIHTYKQVFQTSLTAVYNCAEVLLAQREKTIYRGYFADSFLFDVLNFKQILFSGYH